MDEQELESYAWDAAEEEAGERIDKIIASRLDDRTSRSQVQQWIKEGAVTVHGQPVKSNYKLAPGDVIEVVVPEPEGIEAEPENIPLQIAYEDSDVIVVNKPRGMVVHPSYGHPRGTLVNALLHHCKDLSGIGGVMRPGIVHRIDKDTSGLIMVAKNDQAHASLSAQLKEHSVVRKYYAIVHGVLPHKEGTIDAPIGRSSEDRKLYRVTEKNAKHAVTHFVVAEQFAEYALLELQLETGRTHQIRVHMKFIGHPLVGDPVYGRSKGLKMDGQALHAAVLGFKHPVSGEYLEFQADMPGDMEQLLHILRTG
ncbi:RluA family pseudouridine synthase [Xylanibacillus composti]|uniref:Pseudouridine synthase n=1 Tax=Xylanibacillus composti TaxID=1572762 RepID=A0A8J4GZ61_9BACL|nr:RluA family pseudouridine synthase [Xylanibacillus composti]MDT9724346.1 RluA family pseudouridine synthase [Xylanibacillus composti]GIQ67937.1 pseudouridine synthase [Xylanibacillus composti]